MGVASRVRGGDCDHAPAHSLKKEKKRSHDQGADRLVGFPLVPIPQGTMGAFQDGRGQQTGFLSADQGRAVSCDQRRSEGRAKELSSEISRKLAHPG